jgi:hypothetical protein
MTSRMRWKKPVFILALLFVVDAAANANTVSNSRLKGSTVTALFAATTSTDGCVVTFVSVGAADLVEKILADGTVKSTRSTVFVVQTDICQEDGPVDFLVADGESLTTSLQVAGDGSSAKLTGSITLLDIVGSQFLTLQLNLTWKAIEKPIVTKSNTMFKDKDLGIKVKTKSSSMFAEAIATGTVLGLGVNATPEPSEEGTANIQRAAEATLTIEKD